MIVSTTLAGPGAEASIGAALLSCANLVDEHLILVARAQLESMAAAVKAAGIPINRLRWRVYEWPESYGEARNAALRFAEEEGATWALTVDSDERIDIQQLRADALANPALSVLCVPDRDLGYQKPRLIRCGSGVLWVGACSERLDAPESAIVRIDGEFWELPKTLEQEMARVRRGLEHMPLEIARDNHPNWHRHYAECLISAGEHERACEVFLALVEHPEANVQTVAWAQYRLAEREIQLEQYEQAFCRCALALARAPGFIQEFGYLLAHISIRKKLYAEGVTWAEYALNAPLDMTRGGHRSPTWREGCETILASARDAQGKPAFPFEGRREAFGEDYALLASALIQTLLPGGESPRHLDLGAGNGLLVGAMRSFGVLSHGLEASREAKHATPEHLHRCIDFGVPLEDWAERPTPAVRGFDLVSCVEVAEHIPAERADELVDAVCSRARRWVYWSAARPGQGGHGHVNEQPRDYWIEKFRARGWRVEWGITEDLIARLGHGIRRCRWLVDNALILTKSDGGAF